MRHLLATFLFLAAIPAAARPYFRLLDLAKPAVSVGASIANDGSASAQTVLAIVSHSTADGCLLPTVVCEDWAPLGVGVSMAGGKASIGMGPSVNVAPIIKGALLRLVNASTAEDSMLSLKGAMQPPVDGKPDVAVALGPQFVLVPSERMKGYYRTFVGAAWSFGR